MNCTISWKRLKPDTISGEKIEVKMVYSSMMPEEIDKMEEYCKQNIGSGIVIEQ